MRARSKNRTKEHGVIIVDPSSGLSGDMFLAGLCALGANVREIERVVATLPGLEPFRIVLGRVKRSGIDAWRARVKCPKASKSRNLKSILTMIRRSPLDARIKKHATKAFLVLGEVEGRIHRVPLDKVHFHEVGAVDSIVDIVGAAVALGMLGYPRIYHRPFKLGSGTIQIAHGELPVPAPATLELVKGKTVRFSNEPYEIVTPTGAALMAAFGEELPTSRAVQPHAVVYATGTREPVDSAGILRMIKAYISEAAREVLLLRTTIDDMNPEQYGYLQEHLFEAGALEVYLTQLIMKKGRPGVLVTVLCEQDARERMLEILFSESTTLGVRIAVEQREELERWTETVATSYGDITVKYALLPNGTLKVAPEYESCTRAARREGVPIETVYRSARAAGGMIGGNQKRKR
ncbi:MAG: nickel pincer cofactor biosynthesis protein LarC [bacterium]|nr:MAG: nickel pincer cofactor biosynthesis protein LarC [bacterium]